MATIKSYTDLEQSKKLAEILSLESADMYYSNDNTIYAKTITEYDITHAKVLYGSYDIRSFNVCHDTPCWSISALLNLMICPNIEEYIKGKWDLTTFTDESLKTPIEVQDCESAVDACYNMVLKLHELKLL